MPFVVDASIALPWCFEDEATPFTVAVLDMLRADEGRVPAIWPSEVTNSLVSGERRGRLTQFQTATALALLQALPIVVVTRTLNDDWKSVLGLARDHRLSVDDACSLDLAIREGIPLATLDNRLRAASRRMGVPLLDPNGSSLLTSNTSS